MKVVTNLAGWENVVAAYLRCHTRAIKLKVTQNGYTYGYVSFRLSRVPTLNLMIVMYVDEIHLHTRKRGRTFWTTGVVKLTPISELSNPTFDVEEFLRPIKDKLLLL